MRLIKPIFTVCSLALLATQAYATPIATAEITNNFPVALTLNYADGGSGSITDSRVYEFLHIERDGAVQVTETSNFGTISDAIPGASATATISDNEILNKVVADEGASFAWSLTEAGNTYYVENLSSVTVALDMNVSIDLLTEATGDLAWGYVDQYLGLSATDITGAFYTLGSDYFQDTYMLEHGDLYSNTYPSQMYFEYSFADAPFTGYIQLQSSTNAMVEFQSPGIPTTVPEPGVSILLVMGMGLVAGSLRLRKVNAD